jgi:hypothetical protein
MMLMIIVVIIIVVNVHGEITDLDPDPNFKNATTNASHSDPLTLHHWKFR